MKNNRLLKKIAFVGILPFAVTLGLLYAEVGVVSFLAGMVLVYAIENIFNRLAKKVGGAQS